MDPPESEVSNSAEFCRVPTAYPETTLRRSTSSTSKRQRYNLGDPARPADVNIFQSVDDHVVAVEQLREGDHCFILRSDFSFTYALLQRQEDGVLELQVTEEGCTKSIPKNHWVKYIRTLIRDAPKNKNYSASSPRERREHRHHRSKEIRKRHGRRATVTGGQQNYASTRRASSGHRSSSMPNLDQEDRLDRSKSDPTRERFHSSSSSDLSTNRNHAKGLHRQEYRSSSSESSPSRGVEEGRDHQYHKSKQVRKQHGQGVTVTGTTSMSSHRLTSKESKRSSSMPYLDQKNRLDGSLHSSVSSDLSSSSPSGVDYAETIQSSFQQLPFDKDYGRVESKQQNGVPLKRQPKRSQPRQFSNSMSQVPTTEYKRSVSIQEDIPLSKSLNNGNHHKRSQSDYNHRYRSQSHREAGDDSSSSSSSSLDISSLLESDDSLIRAQKDLDKLLAKSMPTMKRSMKGEQQIQGAFGDVTKIEILD